MGVDVYSAVHQRGVLPGAALALLLGGCAGLPSPGRKPAVPTPTQTVMAYRDALARDDATAAYRLLAPQVRQRISLEQFETDWRETRPERLAQLNALPPPPATTGAGQRATTLSTQAVVSLPQGTALRLEPPARGGPTATSWRVADPDLSTVRAENPEQVLSLLIEAVEHRNYFALLRLLSAGERQAVEGELRERVERLRLSLARQRQPAAPPPAQSPSLPSSAPLPSQPQIEIRGDRAHYQYDPRFFVDLVREKDGWRVLDLN